MIKTTDSDSVSTISNADGSVRLRAYSALIGWVQVDISGDNSPHLHQWLLSNKEALTLAIAPDIEPTSEVMH